MQEVYQDGTVGKSLTADRLEDLIPMIKDSLANPRVKYVKIFNNGEKLQAEEEQTTNKEITKELLEGMKKTITKTFPTKRR